MLDDTNWSTPLTADAFRDALNRFPIGESPWHAHNPLATQVIHTKHMHECQLCRRSGYMLLLKCDM